MNNYKKFTQTHVNKEITQSKVRLYQAIFSNLWVVG